MPLPSRPSLSLVDIAAEPRFARLLDLDRTKDFRTFSHTASILYHAAPWPTFTIVLLWSETCMVGMVQILELSKPWDPRPGCLFTIFGSTLSGRPGCSRVDVL
jgi:hypothetical protein